MYIYIYKNKFGCGCGTHKNIVKETSKSYLEYACVLHVELLKQRKSHERTMTLVCHAHIGNCRQLFRPVGARQHSVANGGAAHPDIYMRTSLNADVGHTKIL